MAGDAQGVTGPVFMRNPGMLVDVTVTAGGTFKQQVIFMPHQHAFWISI